MNNDTIIIGLTGQTGAGKSSVRKILEGQGPYLIDADTVAHDVTDHSKQCVADLALEFSIAILDADGGLDRRKLGDITDTLTKEE